MQAWLASSLTRIFPRSRPTASTACALELARGERGAVQAAFQRGEGARRVTATAEAEGLEVTVRRVGYVPLQHFTTDVPHDEVDGLEYLPGFVPDPLFPENAVLAGPWETQAFWITVRVPCDAPAGTYPMTVTLTEEEGETCTLTAQVTVHAVLLPARRDFPVTHWFYVDAICDWYHTNLEEERCWELLGRYVADLTAHGQDTLYTPLFTPPLDGVKRPTQLLGVQRDGARYRFDWTLVRRWVQLGKAQGITRFEWTHLFTQWGVERALRIYEGHGLEGTLLWPTETGATSTTYRDFLGQFLPEFKAFLEEEGVFDGSIFHLSDEPHGDEHLANYRAARELLRELAPWMQVLDALSDVRFARDGLTDMPVPKLNKVPEFANEGVPCWAYFCCYPRGRYLNRFLDTPLVKVRMSGWILYRTRVLGFLHWGYNYWYQSQTTKLIDPYTVTDALAWPGWTYGDTCMVYPGADGPVDALRWEVFAQSLQDYALLQAAGVDPDDPMLAEIIDYADFPRSEEWIAARRAELFARLEARV